MECVTCGGRHGGSARVRRLLEATLLHSGHSAEATSALAIIHFDTHNTLTQRVASMAPRRLADGVCLHRAALLKLVRVRPTLRSALQRQRQRPIILAAKATGTQRDASCFAAQLKSGTLSAAGWPTD